MVKKRVAYSTDSKNKVVEIKLQELNIKNET